MIPEGRKLLSQAVAFAVLLAAPGVSTADEPHEPESTQVHLSAEVEETVPNDEAAVTLRYQAEGEDVADLRRRVNETSVAVGKRLDDEPGLKTKTLGRNVQEIRDRERNTRVGWRLVQRTEVVSSRLDEVASWLGDVERLGAQVERLEFRVKTDTLRTVREKLRTQAIEAFLRKAETVAASLRAETFRVAELHTGEEPDPRPFPMQTSRALMSAEAAPEPDLESGEGRVSVAVRGRILLPFRDFPVE